MGAEPADRNALDRFFGVVYERRTHRNFLYLLVSIPLGLLYFLIFAVGFALGVGLVIVGVGVVVVVVLLALSHLFVVFEFSLTKRLLGVEIGDPSPVVGDGLLARLRDLVTTPSTWSGVGYLLAKFPLALIALVLFGVGVPLSASLIAAPFVYTLRGVRYDLLVVTVDTLPETVAVSLIGVLLAFVTMHLVNAIAAAWGRVARVLLAQV